MVATVNQSQGIHARSLTLVRDDRALCLQDRHPLSFTESLACVSPCTVAMQGSTALAVRFMSDETCTVKYADCHVTVAQRQIAP